ncbi:glycoside hydrolase family 88/105 protein [Edaphobacter albus]|uniref:glycoside hydrolase family 88/105 protein n=1 Tax=Edaphobacter sp. 4G125 TaxID=2763071 RepID=UPI0016455E5B|nr:glycoside hydrolase family 88 protein [Edaphobacter sp. 4G125]QNI38295.1 glycoside hydrolase family 88 protein [Edaphobacter sp. 4G125]
MGLFRVAAFGCAIGFQAIWCAGAWAEGALKIDQPSAKMAESVMRQWPNGVVSTQNHPSAWGYEEGVLLDGMAAQWHTTANGDDYRYIKAAVDKYVTEDGTIKTYHADAHSLDEIEMGRSVLLVYRVSQQPKYYKAAKFIHDQLASQPRTSSGGYWHKQIYPNQMWLDGAYMAEPFRAEYAATFQQPEDFNDIAKQLLLMDQHMRDARTGLLRHGWDESKQMKWADPKTGLSPEAWGRAMGWYAMALVDVLDWFPVDHPDRPELVRALNRVAKSIVTYQDKKTSLWWQVLDKSSQKGNFTEASASCMFVYSLAKGVRMGYLPQADLSAARRGWSAIQAAFVTATPDGLTALKGTVKVGGLGGTPYRSGTFDYYIGEKTILNDAKGIGAFLLAGSEMAQAPTEALGQGKTVLVDAWFNSQTRKNAAGQAELFHYKWDDDANSGFAFFGRAFQRYGVRLDTLKTAPTVADLKKAQIYIISSPDIPAKNPHPNYMDKASGDAIEAWVKAGGVLILMENDKNNSEFEHFNTLSERFGIHFNAVLRNTVDNNNWPQGTVMIPKGTGIFEYAHKAYLKEISTITPEAPAKSILTDQGDVLMAVAKVGKGIVFAVVDPWIYNEYVDRRNNLPLDFDGFDAAIDLAGWAVRQAK